MKTNFDGYLRLRTRIIYALIELQSIKCLKTIEAASQNIAIDAATSLCDGVWLPLLFLRHLR